jgi:Putative DNA-binding domain
MNAALVQKEALRQQMLLRALWGDARPGVVTGWLRDDAPRATRGLQAYGANAGALAERALGAAFPTVAQLVGDESFAGLARAFWRTEPPLRGDIAQWGAGLPAFIGAAPQLAEEPYLADVARLDWAVHGAEQSSDRVAAPTGLEALADAEPARLRLRLASGTALVSSAHPVATIWHAHRSDAPDRFDPVRAAFAKGRGEHALVWRDGYQAQVAALPEPDARFMRAVTDGLALDRALDLAGAGFAFEPWLLAALRQGWLAAVDVDSHSDSRNLE